MTNAEPHGGREKAAERLSSRGKTVPSSSDALALSKSPRVDKAWKDNGKAGAGRVEVVESTPASKVGIELDFIKPFEGHNLAEFRLTLRGDGTQADWVMRGPTPFVSKLMQVLFSLDTMIGKDFDAGLANLKALTEK